MKILAAVSFPVSKARAVQQLVGFMNNVKNAGSEGLAKLRLARFCCTTPNFITQSGIIVVVVLVFLSSDKIKGPYERRVENAQPLQT